MNKDEFMNKWNAIPEDHGKIIVMHGGSEFYCTSYVEVRGSPSIPDDVIFPSILYVAVGKVRIDQIEDVRDGSNDATIGYVFDRNGGRGE